MSGEQPWDRLWRHRIAQLADPHVDAVVVVQLDLAWLRPERIAVRNALDLALVELQQARPRTSIQRLILHSLPAPADGKRLDTAVKAAFEEWNRRLALSQKLVNYTPLPSTVIRRLIISGRVEQLPIADTIQVRRHGRWTGQDDAQRALELALRPGDTTLLTDIELRPPYLDDDPTSLL